MESRATLAFVIPVYNEEATIAEIYRRLQVAVGEIANAVEFIFVNDGSTDTTLEQLRRIAAQDPRCRVLSLSRNVGQTRAIAVGLRQANAEAVVTIAADLQDAPEFVPTMIAKWREGYDVVSAVPEPAPQVAGVGKIRRMIRGALPRDWNSGEFRLFSARAVEAISQMLDSHASLPGAIRAIGYRQISLPVEHPPRPGGSRISATRRFSRVFELSLVHTKWPLRAAIFTGFAAVVLALLVAIGTLLGAIVGGSVPPLLMIFVWIALGTGLQLIFLGVVGEYVARTMEEVRSPPVFIADIISGSTVAAADRARIAAAPTVAASVLLESDIAPVAHVEPFAQVPSTMNRTLSGPPSSPPSKPAPPSPPSSPPSVPPARPSKPPPKPFESLKPPLYESTPPPPNLQTNPPSNRPPAPRPEPQRTWLGISPSGPKKEDEK